MDKSCAGSVVLVATDVIVARCGVFCVKCISLCGNDDVDHFSSTRGWQMYSVPQAQPVVFMRAVTRNLDAQANAWEKVTYVCCGNLHLDCRPSPQKCMRFSSVVGSAQVVVVVATHEQTSYRMSMCIECLVEKSFGLDGASVSDEGLCVARTRERAHDRLDSRGRGLERVAASAWLDACRCALAVLECVDQDRACRRSNLCLLCVAVFCSSVIVRIKPENSVWAFVVVENLVEGLVGCEFVPSSSKAFFYNICFPGYADRLYDSVEHSSFGVQTRLVSSRISEEANTTAPIRDHELGLALYEAVPCSYLKELCINKTSDLEESLGVNRSAGERKTVWGNSDLNCWDDHLVVTHTDDTELLVGFTLGTLHLGRLVESWGSFDTDCDNAIFCLVQVYARTVMCSLLIDPLATGYVNGSPLRSLRFKRLQPSLAGNNLPFNTSKANPPDEQLSIHLSQNLATID
ncbi:hypothetical protein Tco_0267497 [Tanacetum coccineum]